MLDFRRPIYKQTAAYGAWDSANVLEKCCVEIKNRKIYLRFPLAETGIKTVVDTVLFFCKLSNLKKMDVLLAIKWIMMRDVR